LKGQIMAAEMIEGAEYMWGERRFTFLYPHESWSRFGWYRDESGNKRAISTDVFEPAPKPPHSTPFPEPERWAQHEEWVDFVKFSSKESKGFCAASEIASASAVNQHNAEIDRLMREIRRLEALVESGGVK
jgi:hypothetical protein